jgi:predicted metal-dependent peptidase
MSNYNKQELKDLTLKLFEEGDLKKAEEYAKEYLEITVFSMAKNDQFFCHLLMQLSRRIDWKWDFPAAVMLTDRYYYLLINPLLLFKFSDEEIKSVLIHESYHIIFRHIPRSKKFEGIYDHDYVNIAEDCAINQLIDNLPEGTVTLDFVNRICNKQLSAKQDFEYYLEALKNSDQYKDNQELKEKVQEFLKRLDDALNDKNNDDNKNNNSSGFGIKQIPLGSSNDDNKDENNNDNSNNNDNQDQSKESREQRIANNVKQVLDDLDKENRQRMKDGKPQIVIYMKPSHDQWKKSDVNDVDNANEITKDLLQNVINSCNNRGTIPAHVIQELEKMSKKPEISWQNELKYLTGNVKVPYRKTFTRPNRRLPERLDISGQKMDRTLKLVVAIDTSGSVDENQLLKIFNEIFSIIKSVKYELTIIECDADVQNVYKAKTIKDVNLKVKGRGGTCFTPVFKYLKTERKMKGTDLLIYFTDGYGECEISEEFRPRGYNVMWVVTYDKNNLSVKNPFTRRVKTLNMK